VEVGVSGGGSVEEIDGIEVVERIDSVEFFGSIDAFEKTKGEP
jgi:hypothetical protein